MSMKSQENNIRRLAILLKQNLSYIGGERECGPNGAKKAFLNLGKVFLRALAKDLGLRDVRVMSNPGGIAVSGECCLYGMYRTIRNINDHKGGYNRYLTLHDLEKLSYGQLLDTLSELRKDENGYERAA